MTSGVSADGLSGPRPSSTIPGLGAADHQDVRIARSAVGLLQVFNEAGVLTAADVHVATLLLRLARGAGAGGGGAEAEAGGGEPEAGAGGGGAEAEAGGGEPEAGAGGGEDGHNQDLVALGIALAVRGPRLGHICTDLATIRNTVGTDAEFPIDLQLLPWPDPDHWIAALRTSPLVAVGDDGPADRPLRLSGTTLYLDRYWRQERQVAADLAARSIGVAGGVDVGHLARGLGRLFSGPEPDYQKMAAATAVLRRLSVVAGGPGTGKTTTVARILALLDEQAATMGRTPPLVALAAPTGKAAARLEEAVHAEAERLDVSEETRSRLLAMRSSTLHRLLGWRPDSHSRFRHHRDNRLPHDAIIVDETSMISLSLMSKLVEALGINTRLILVGDPEQLSSVEAGAVLGDIVGPAADGLMMGTPAAQLLSQATGQPVHTDATQGPTATAVGDGIVVLRQVHRFGGGIAALAEAVRLGDADAAVQILSDGRDDVEWVAVDVADAGAGAGAGAGAERLLAPVRVAVVHAGLRVMAAARAGQSSEALSALGAFRLLCAHRRGDAGVLAWTRRIETWLATEIDGFGAGGPWFVGRPLMVTENDYGLRLYNGDSGVIISTTASPDAPAAGATDLTTPASAVGAAVVAERATVGRRRVSAVFERGGVPLEFRPSRLGAVETVYAMTVHKSQGSQFDTVAIVLPGPESPILTRELLYTAATRARRRVILAGTEAAVRSAIGRPIARASGLRRRLWEISGGSAPPRIARHEGGPTRL